MQEDRGWERASESFVTGWWLPSLQPVWLRPDINPSGLYL